MIGRSMIAPPRVLSPSSILPSDSFPCAFISASKHIIISVFYCLIVKLNNLKFFMLLQFGVCTLREYTCFFHRNGQTSTAGQPWPLHHDCVCSGPYWECLQLSNAPLFQRIEGSYWVKFIVVWNKGSHFNSVYFRSSTISIFFSAVHFRRFRKIAKTVSYFQVCLSICLSVCPHGTTRLPPAGFWQNLIFELFRKIYLKHLSFIKPDK
jgi:hypothetical protein